MTTPHAPTVRELDHAECWTLLRHTRIGRIAIATEHGVDIFPVNFLVHDGAVYFRTAPGSKLVDITEEPAVTFEADGKRWGRWWSVIVHGTAVRLHSDAEITESTVVDLRSESPTRKWNFVRVFPLRLTGRSFRAHRHPRRLAPEHRA
jgi:uncharacterized protein